jgi:hypothetical protein
VPRAGVPISRISPPNRAMPPRFPDVSKLKLVVFLPEQSSVWHYPSHQTSYEIAYQGDIGLGQWVTHCQQKNHGVKISRGRRSGNR